MSSVPRPRAPRQQRLAGLGVGLGVLVLVAAPAGFTAFTAMGVGPCSMRDPVTGREIGVGTPSFRPTDGAAGCAFAGGRPGSGDSRVGGHGQGRERHLRLPREAP